MSIYAVTWLKYCRYGVKPYPITQLIISIICLCSRYTQRFHKICPLKLHEKAEVWLCDRFVWNIYIVSTKFQLYETWRRLYQKLSVLKIPLQSFSTHSYLVYVCTWHVHLGIIMFHQKSHYRGLHVEIQWKSVFYF